MYKVFPPGKIRVLYHVGTMDYSRKRKDSHEGDGLSVSICPEVWERITEGYSHGATHTLYKENPRLLDYYALTSEQKSEVSEWGKSQGYVQETILYKAIFYDEDGKEYYSLHLSREEALEESEETEEIQGLIPTEKLKAETYTNIDLISVFDVVLEKYTEQVLGYDGIYWDEELDVFGYSAPRGVIFNSRLVSFQIDKQH